MIAAYGMLARSLLILQYGISFSDLNVAVNLLLPFTFTALNSRHWCAQFHKYESVHHLHTIDVRSRGMDFERIDRPRHRRSLPDTTCGVQGNAISLLPPNFAAAIEKVVRALQ